MHRRTGQRSFADEVVADKGHAGKMDRISEVIDWDAVANLVAPVYSETYRATVLSPIGDGQGFVAGTVVQPV